MSSEQAAPEPEQPPPPPAPQFLTAGDNIHVELTHEPLDITTTINRVRSPKAGAIVLFAGTTRDTFANSPVLRLTYTSYPPLALRTLLSIATSLHKSHGLTAISIVHRLGVVPIGEESILIAVSAPHRQEAWRGGEDALEECKARVEVWKREEFVGGEGEAGGVWRANRDGQRGVQVSGPGGAKRERRGSLEELAKVEPGEQEDR